MLEQNALGSAFFNYWRDSCERSVLFLDVLRERGNVYRTQSARTAPHVLSFDCELLVDGRSLPKPVNYVLVRIKPPAGVVVDPGKRPVIVFDPRAGHGPGIGGMKHDSEIGVALRAGHPCYFVGFLPRARAGTEDRGRMPRGGAFRATSSRSGTSKPTASPCSSAIARRAGRS